jgi:hypothetical protein
MRWEEFRLNVNSDSGMVNTHSGKYPKMFTFSRNGCSRSIRIGVHVEPEWVFTMGRNMHLPAWNVFEDNAAQNYPFLTTVNPAGINFALYDPSQTAYGASGHLDLITLTPSELAKFPVREFSIFCDIVDYTGEGGGGYGFDGDALYQAFFSVDSVSIASEVPLPAAAWLFFSALGGLAIAKRKQLQAQS